MATLTANRLTRRRFTAAAATLALTCLHAARPSGALAQIGTPEISKSVDWEAFDASLEAAMTTFDMAGAAVSVVTVDDIAYRRMFGVRNTQTGETIDPDTHFLVASTTKSMTALLVATYVDEGVLSWDQPVHEIFPDFRAPTSELTQNLRVRDMLDMASGIGEPDAISAFHQGDPTTDQLLNLLGTLPVIASPGAEFFYNGTVYSAGGYLPALALGVDPADLGPEFANQMTERVYRPCGMTTARITDDPRPFSDNYATGYAPDLTLGTSEQPFAPVGSYAPAGGTMATHTEMTSYLMMQLNGGVAPDGTRVVSEENLAECWSSNVDVPFDATATPDLERAGYGLGWLSFTYRGGRRYISHAGGIDGFTTYLAFLPGDGVGLVVNTNTGPLSRGVPFVQYVSALLLEAWFGLDSGAAETVLSQYKASAQAFAELAELVSPVDEVAIAPWLGYYERGWRITAGGGAVHLRQSSRAIPLLALPDGSYVMGSGVAPGSAVKLSKDESGLPRLEIVGLETVRWTTGESE